MKILTAKYLKRSHNNGFTLIEVLVGIIMATAFVLVAVQAIAISAVYRVQAQRKAEALLAIQDDVETIKFSSLQLASSPENCTAGYASILGDAFPDATNSVTLLNKTYDMTRTAGQKSADQPHVMTLEYEVSDPDSGRIIAELYTEVIPYAAFDCE